MGFVLPGGAAVFLGRFTAFLRAVTPALAGAARMPDRRFVAWNVVGGIVWAAAAALVGCTAGASYSVAVVVAVGLVVRSVRRRRSPVPAS